MTYYFESSNHKQRLNKKLLMHAQSVVQKLLKFVKIWQSYSQMYTPTFHEQHKAGVSNTRPAGRMPPAKLFCAARDHVHEV